MRFKVGTLIFFFAVALGLFALCRVSLPLTAYAQPAEKVYRIGVLSSAWSPWHSNTDGFRDALKELGFVDGKNVVFAARGMCQRL